MITSPDSRALPGSSLKRVLFAGCYKTLLSNNFPVKIFATVTIVTGITKVLILLFDCFSQKGGRS